MTLSNEGGLGRGEESSELEDRFLWGFNGDFLIIVSGADLTESLKTREKEITNSTRVLNVQEQV